MDGLRVGESRWISQTDSRGPTGRDSPDVAIDRLMRLLLRRRLASVHPLKRGVRTDSGIGAPPDGGGTLVRFTSCKGSQQCLCFASGALLRPNWRELPKPCGSAWWETPHWRAPEVTPAKTPPGWYRDTQGRLVRDHDMQMPLSMGRLFLGSLLIVAAGIVAAMGTVGLPIATAYGRGGFGATSYFVLFFGTIALGLAFLGVRALRARRTRY